VKHKAVFLDRDGTIIEDVGYLNNLDNITFIGGALESLRALQQQGFKLVVVTNQSGVARGFFTEGFVHTTHAKIQDLLDKQGITLDGFYYCPHYPDGIIRKYAIECGCRKPKTGMLKKAKRDLGLDLSASYMVGDHYADIGLGKNAGLKSIFVMTGHGPREWKDHHTWEHQPDYVARDISDAARWIILDQKNV
jgi:D,D-heptose 1,7-bisphosphate phosphatase